MAPVPGACVMVDVVFEDGRPNKNNKNKMKKKISSDMRSFSDPKHAN